MESIEDCDYAWTDFEPETEMTGDGSGDPDKYILTIWHYGEEYATIVHRTCNGLYPLDGDIANEKRARAGMIVNSIRLVKSL